MKKIFFISHLSISKILLFSLVFLIRFYQVCISPWIGKNCRFHPTCSNYILKAIKIYRFYGIYLGLIRIMRCHPYGSTGYDPVPKKIGNMKSMD